MPTGELYGHRAYAPAAYQRQIAERVAALARQHGVGRTTPAGARRVPALTARRGRQQPAPAVSPAEIGEAVASDPVQLSLL